MPLQFAGVAFTGDFCLTADRVIMVIMAVMWRVEQAAAPVDGPSGSLPPATSTTAINSAVDTAACSGPSCIPGYRWAPGAHVQPRPWRLRFFGHLPGASWEVPWSCGSVSSEGPARRDGASATVRSAQGVRPVVPWHLLADVAARDPGEHVLRCAVSCVQWVVCGRRCGRGT